jgi:hypothetical protein
MTITLATALRLVRSWTRIYTARMEREARDARRDEIESDLWEFHEDARRRGASPTGIALHMLLRLALGAPDDLLWRAEQIHVRPRLVREALWTVAAASIAFVWWLSSALQAVDPQRSYEPINVVRLLYPVHPVARVPLPLPAPPPIDFGRARRSGRAACSAEELRDGPKAVRYP